jgi:hypothetical protein
MAAAPAGLVVVTLYYTKNENLHTFATLFDRSLRHRAETAGARTLAAYVSSTQENNFPRLPIRVGEHIFVWVAQFANPAAYAAYQSKLAADKQSNQTRWRELIARDREVLRSHQRRGHGSGVSDAFRGLLSYADIAFYLAQLFAARLGAPMTGRTPQVLEWRARVGQCAPLC